MADTKEYIWGTGRRKASIARVRICKGSGEFTVNGKKSDDYFTTPRQMAAIIGPLKHLDVEKDYDIFVNVRGGGTTGQAGAIMMGLGRALLKAEPEKESLLRNHGFLSRDPRMVERKKPGKPGARKSFQFSKR